MSSVFYQDFEIWKKKFVGQISQIKNVLFHQVFQIPSI
jgi:hypothetical protein